MILCGAAILCGVAVMTPLGFRFADMVDNLLTHPDPFVLGSIGLSAVIALTFGSYALSKASSLDAQANEGGQIKIEAPLIPGRAEASGGVGFDGGAFPIKGVSDSISRSLSN